MTPPSGIAPTLTPTLAVSRAASNQRSYQVCWRRIISRSITRAIVLNIDTIGADRCAIEAWIEGGEARRVLLRKSILPCAIANDDGMMHLDVHRQNERVLAMTLRTSDDELLYCRSDLLAKAGFAGGSYDPPRGETTDERPMK